MPARARDTSQGTDPLVGDRRRAGRLRPNTMYPLLRSPEERGLLAGEWEQPVRRSRRLYRITREGEAERARLQAELERRLGRIARSIRAIRKEIV